MSIQLRTHVRNRRGRPVSITASMPPGRPDDAVANAAPRTSRTRGAAGAAPPGKGRGRLTSQLAGHSAVACQLARQCHRQLPPAHWQGGAAMRGSWRRDLPANRRAGYTRGASAGSFDGEPRAMGGNGRRARKAKARSRTECVSSKGSRLKGAI